MILEKREIKFLSLVPVYQTLGNPILEYCYSISCVLCFVYVTKGAKLVINCPITRTKNLSLDSTVSL